MEIMRQEITFMAYGEAMREHGLVTHKLDPGSTASPCFPEQNNNLFKLSFLFLWKGDINYYLTFFIFKGNETVDSGGKIIFFMSLSLVAWKNLFLCLGSRNVWRQKNHLNFVRIYMGAVILVFQILSAIL